MLDCRLSEGSTVPELIHQHGGSWHTAADPVGVLAHRLAENAEAPRPPVIHATQRVDDAVAEEVDRIDRQVRAERYGRRLSRLEVMAEEAQARVDAQVLG
jgi:hypothetical protein